MQRFLVGLHRASAHSNRIGKLSTAIGGCIQELFPCPDKVITALDVGCGDMTVAETISSDNPTIQWACTDIHELPPHLHGTEKWKKYRKFDGSKLPFDNASFDVVLFSDVLHHCLPASSDLLREAGRVARFVVVKDHFEKGLFSRATLRLLDFIGNYGYGVSVPECYFDELSFQASADAAGLRIMKMIDHLPIYPFPLSMVLPQTLQFLAVLERAAHENV